jgi:hypothetical protein
MTAPALVVVAKESGIVFGPFASRGEAVRFAAYLTEEVDPAEVRILCSPVLELLNWRDHSAETSRKDTAS